MCLNRGGKEGPQAADQEAGWEQPQLWWWGALQSTGSVDWLHSSCPLTTGSSHCCVLHLSHSVSLQGLAASLFLSFSHYWVQQWLCPSFFCVSLQGLAASLFLFFSHYWVQPLLSFISVCITAWFNCFTLLVLSLLGPAIAVSFLSLCITAWFDHFTLLVLLLLLDPAIAVPFLSLSLSLLVSLQNFTASLFVSSSPLHDPVIAVSFLSLSHCGVWLLHSFCLTTVSGGLRVEACVNKLKADWAHVCIPACVRLIQVVSTSLVTDSDLGVCF